MIGNFSKLTVFVSVAFFLTTSTEAVKKFRISNYDKGHQIWFEAEDYDERNPDDNKYYDIIPEKKAPKDSFGEVINRTGMTGGYVRWTFDIKRASGKGGDCLYHAGYLGTNMKQQRRTLFFSYEPSHHADWFVSLSDEFIEGCTQRQKRLLHRPGHWQENWQQELKGSNRLK